MNDVRLITVDDLKEVTSISNNISPDLLEPYLEISEGFYCDNLLGDALLTELRNQITGNSLTTLNQTLLIQFIRPVIAYGAWHEYVPFNMVKSTPAGEVKQSGSNSQSADLKEIAFKQTALKDKVTYYQSRLKEYLENNKNQYPLYRSNCTTEGSNWAIYLGKSN